MASSFAAMEISKALFESTLSELCLIHSVNALKDLQRLCLFNLANNRDVFACLPTGYGKSLIYQAWPTLCRLLARQHPTRWQDDHAMVLVVCPLVSVIEEQVAFLNARGIKAAYAGQTIETDERIAMGDFTVVFGAPETFVSSNKWRNVLQTPMFRRCLVGLAVDEVHTMVKWGEGQGDQAPFRKWCGLVGELRSILPSAVPVMATTATASRKTRKNIIKHLGMHKCLEVVKSPDRANIRLAVKKVSSDAKNTFAWLCNDLEKQGPNTDKTVIYCSSVSECSLLYDDVFLPLLGQKSVHPAGEEDMIDNRLIDMFHSLTPEEVKKHIITSLSDPSSILRIVIATSALGMGVDFKGVNLIVNYGPPRDLDMYMQAYGRAGRDGSQAHSLILYHGRQMTGVSDHMRQYVYDGSTCRRMKLFMLFDREEVGSVEPKHSCCDNCAILCNCKDACCGNASALEQHAGKKISPERNVTVELKSELQERLENLSGDMASAGGSKDFAVYSVNEQLAIPWSDVVRKVVDQCHLLFSLEDIFCNIPVSNLTQAQSILDIVCSVFQSDADTLNAVSAFENMDLSD